MDLDSNEDDREVAPVIFASGVDGVRTNPVITLKQVSLIYL